MSSVMSSSSSADVARAVPRADPGVSDDHGAVADSQLRAMVLADTYALDEAERSGEPRHGLADSSMLE
jgi:hypothetical protein